jgi:hypothetical protein
MLFKSSPGDFMCGWGWEAWLLRPQFSNCSGWGCVCVGGNGPEGLLTGGIPTQWVWGWEGRLCLVYNSPGGSTLRTSVSWLGGEGGGRRGGGGGGSQRWHSCRKELAPSLWLSTEQGQVAAAGQQMSQLFGFASVPLGSSRAAALSSAASPQPPQPGVDRAWPQSSSERHEWGVSERRKADSDGRRIHLKIHKSGTEEVAQLAVCAALIGDPRSVSRTMWGISQLSVTPAIQST